MDRPQVSQETVAQVMDDLVSFLQEKRGKKGHGAWVSLQEMYGKLQEENFEVLMELHRKDPVKFAEEMRDIAVVAIWSLMSLKTINVKGKI